jgi:hypothetical protein
MLRVSILGMYLAIVVMSGWATWLLLTRLVIPAIRSRELKVERYMIGLGAFFAMLSHFQENILFGLGRWHEELRYLLTDARFAAVGKVLILAGAICTLAALDRAHSGQAHIRRWIAIAAGLWGLGVTMAVMWGLAI